MRRERADKYADLSEKQDGDDGENGPADERHFDVPFIRLLAFAALSA